MVQIQDFSANIRTPQATFSYNTSRIDRKSNTPNQRLDLQAVAQLIRQGYHKYAANQYAAIQTAARSWYEQGDHRAQSNLDALKKGLAWLQPTGYNKYGHATKGLTPNGLVQIDIDFHFKGGNQKASALKQRLKKDKSPFIVLCALSPTTYGLKIFVKTDIAPDAMTEEVYRFAQDKIIAYFSNTYSIDSQYFDHFGIAQTCYLPYDPSVYIAENATAFKIDVAAHTAEQAAKKATKSVFKLNRQANNQALPQAVQFLLDNKINVANCYSEYLVFTTACKNAFDTENTEGVAIAFQILDNSEHFQLSNFKKNFDSLVKSISNKAITGDYILNIAKKHGFVYQPPTANVAAHLSDHIFNNLDLFIVERAKAMDYIQKDTGDKIIVCETSFMDKVPTGPKTRVCTYSDLSKAKSTITKETTIYVFGSQNLGRKHYINAANEVENVAKYAKTILFADTPTYLNIARNTTTIDRHTPKINVLVSDKPQATFVETVKKYAPTDALFCETSESINKQLKNYTLVKRSELYAADHNKTLVVLYDSNVGLMPDAFTQFKNVVFIAASEKKACVSMSDYCEGNSKNTQNALNFLDNTIFCSQNEKMFLEAVKNRTLAIRRNKDVNVWERCPNTEGVLENEHLVKTLVSDADALQQYIKKIAAATHQTAEITADTTTIADDIKQAKIDLAAEKKNEYFAFLDAIVHEGIAEQAELKDYVASQDTMTRGAKIAYNRLKTLSKINTQFATCFEAVYESYNHWTQTKGRFLAAKIINRKTKIGNDLDAFKKATDGNRYDKIELLDIAKTMLPMLNNNDNEAWKELKRFCFVSSKTGRRDGKVLKLYEVHFLE